MHFSQNLPEFILPQEKIINTLARKCKWIFLIKGLFRKSLFLTTASN